MSFLVLEDISKSYVTNGSRSPVLVDINLRIEQGEFVAIAGYSGAGKTTLISLIAGLLEPDRGRILFQGRKISGPGPDRGIVFQNYSLLPWLTVHENVRLAVDQVFRDWTQARRRAHTERYIDLVHLTSAAWKRPGELSGGMRQRVALARALAMEPGILLLDEPLSALDALTRGTLQQEIERISSKERRTIVLITNDVDEGILLADRLIPLTAGPPATLGPSIPIDIPRPRDRKALNHDPRYREIRREVIEFLLASKRRGEEARAREVGLRAGMAVS